MNIRELNKLKTLVEIAIIEERVYFMKTWDAKHLEELSSLKESMDKEINTAMLNSIPDIYEVYKSSKLRAVKLVKAYTGLGLIESKKLIEERFG